MFTIRDFRKDDSLQVNALAIHAFNQFKDAYIDWAQFKIKIGEMASLAEVGEIIVAEADSKIVGAVAYIGPGAPKADFFRPEWPVMRMLVVDPTFRGLGIGRALADECIVRAKRDGASMFALHTSKLMQVALPMYERMGFKWISNAPDIHGVGYGIYVKNLSG